MTTTGSYGLPRDKHGFQGSMTSRVQVVFYSLQREHKRFGARSPVQDDVLICAGKNEHSEFPSVVSCTVSNSFGTAGGSFSLRLKPGLVQPHDLREKIFEDDWVDIVFSRHGQPYHTFRGMVDTVVRERRIVNGATDVTFEVNGRGFGKPFEVTPIWFDRFSEGDYIALAASRMWNSDHTLFAGTPDAIVRGILFGFLAELRNVGRAVFELPNLPGEPSNQFGDFKTSDSFAKGVNVVGMFESRGFKNDPFRRSTILPSQWNPSDEGNHLWPLAQAFSDPMLAELYCDLAPAEDQDAPSFNTDNADFALIDPAAIEAILPGEKPYFEKEQPVPLGAARMKVHFRDRPFPSVSRVDESLNGLQGPYFTEIPLYISAFEGVRDERIARSGIERRNAFFSAPKLYQEIAGAAGFDINRPLINRDDIRNHGFRRMDHTSRYTYGAVVKGSQHAEAVRELIRDYHSLNDRYLSGTITLAPGRPDIRIGGRLRVLEPRRSADSLLGAEGDEGDYITYYVEGVTHTWNMAQGLITNCIVTRGWRGTDASLIEAIETESEFNYELPEVINIVDPDKTLGKEIADNPDPTLPSLCNTDINAEGGCFPTDSDRYDALFAAASAAAGTPPEWPSWPAFKDLYNAESGGWVGALNPAYGATIFRDKHLWPAIWRELRQGIRSSNARTGRDSSASGLGQLQLANVEEHYPGATPEAKRAGIGIAFNEAVGMLLYIKNGDITGETPTHGDPNAAWAFFTANRYY